MPKLTKKTLQLADRSIHHPQGIIKDILVKVGKLISLIDFVILDLDDKVKMPLILRRRFLTMSQALIDVKDRRMVVRVGEEVEFKLQVAMRHSMDFDDSCYFVDCVDDYIAESEQDAFLMNE